MKFITDTDTAVPVENIEYIGNKEGKVTVFCKNDLKIHLRFSEDAAVSFMNGLSSDIVPAPVGYYVAFFYPGDSVDPEPLVDKVQVLAFMISRQRCTMAVPITSRGVADLWDDNVVLVEPDGTASNEESTFSNLESFISMRSDARKSS